MGRKKNHKWYEKYLPFVARSPEMQVRWLENALRKGTLNSQEVAPYIKLLFEGKGDEQFEILAPLIRSLDEQITLKMMEAADIYDAPILLKMLGTATMPHAVLALQKVPPPYEKKTTLVSDKIFQAIHDSSEKILEQAAHELKQSGKAPEHFAASYERFKEIVEDEKLLSALYPKAKV